MARTASRAFRKGTCSEFSISRNSTVLYYVILAGFLCGFLLIFRTINSPFGEVLKAIRENEPRAISLGYKTDQYKLLAYILSGTLAGFAGSLKVFVAQNASLTDVHWTMSGEIVLMTLVGGLGTVFGPVVGAFVIIAMQQYLAGFGQWVTVIQGVIFVVCVLTFRRGVIGEIAHYFRRSLCKRNISSTKVVAAGWLKERACIGRDAGNARPARRCGDALGFDERAQDRQRQIGVMAFDRPVEPIRQLALTRERAIPLALVIGDAADLPQRQLQIDQRQRRIGPGCILN